MKVRTDYYEGKFLNVESFLAEFPEESVTTKVTGFGEESVNGAKKAFVRLHGVARPLLLNRSNCLRLVQAFSNETDNWMNRRVELLVAETSSPSGEATRGLMIRPMPEAKAPGPGTQTADSDNAPY